ncbi:MAG TPA: tRNA (adenosine(37)-N6)-dimethylallyltransferase MiaA [Acidimicrobiia bacterium]|nr:tRNA (adenosine(37)-N6)-dimethylallyltransferase MiaA [Acidimicrobiia bacterium]
MALVGPTAAGKSRVAMALAQRVGAEILSVDSMQVYRGMDIGTAKATLSDRELVRHHMIDIAEPEEPFTVARFRRVARQAIEQSSADVILIVGGSGLHFRSVVDPMVFRPFDPQVRAAIEQRTVEDLIGELEAADPDASRYIDFSNPRRVRRAVEALRVGGVTPSALAVTEEHRRFEEYRPELPFVGFGIDTEDIDQRVVDRLAAMRGAGFLEEVERLAPRLGPTAVQAVGYRQLLPVVRGELDVEAGFEDAARATLRLVKRQRTFFRRDPRLQWLDGNDESVVETVLREARL